MGRSIGTGNSSDALYDEDYFERGPKTGRSLYERYRWIPEKTLPYCHRMIVSVGIRPGQSILDFGCAKGFYVKALRLLGYNAFGVDVSPYAIGHADEDTRPYLFLGSVPSAGAQSLWDWVHAKDVLEHIEERKMEETLRTLAIVGARIFAIVPLAVDGKYIIESHEKDATHVIREPLSWWEQALKSAGWSVLATTGIRGLKPHYDVAYPNGHGYIVGWNEAMLNEDCDVFDHTVSWNAMANRPSLRSFPPA